jgi:hypothetical protein
MLFVKFIVLLLLSFVIVALFSGLYFLVKDKGQTRRTANALTVRIGLSIVAIVVIIIAGATGVIDINPNPMYGEGAVASEAEQPEAPAAPQSGRRRE